jgi:hypothetical protein
MVGTKEGAAKSPWVQRLREMSAALQAQKLTTAVAKATARPKRAAKQCKHECSDKPPAPEVGK